MIFNGAIVIPAGSGKTTLSKKYKNLYDIDAFHTEEDIKVLNQLYKETTITNNWTKYNTYEISLIKEKISELQTPFILLLHSKEKADLLGLTYLGACKISRNIMEMKAIERGYTDKLREEMTRSNWENCDATIFDSYEDINRFVVETCKLYDIDMI